jgi:hypothetical protein
MERHPDRSGMDSDFGSDCGRFTYPVEVCRMTLPFLALAPFMPKVVDVFYEATTLPCLDVTDASDATDSSDVTDGDDLVA